MTQAASSSQPRALVTGASSGIGRAIVPLLAARGYDLVLTARRQALLEEVAAEVKAKHAGLEVETIAADLGTAGGARGLWERATEKRGLDVLVNNAGFGTFRTFTSAEWERDAELLQLNVVSLVELCHRFVSAARTRDSAAYILNVASIAAYQSIPNFANYGASKAYVRNFSEALHDELAATKVRVTCLCPGGTKTPFHDAAGAGNYGKLANASMMTAEDVAAIGVAAMLAGRRTVIPGAMNKVSCFGVRLVPRSFASKVASWVLGKPRSAALPSRSGGSAG
jgi:short-subunit dehydrogenase